MVYSPVCPCPVINVDDNLKLTPTKTGFLLIGKERQWNKYLFMFPIELSLSKLSQKSLLGILRRLEYRNSLLYGKVYTGLSKHQHIQNCVALSVTKPPSFTTSLSLFRTLFKMNVLTQKTLSDNKPVFLHSMLAPSLTCHSTRSSKGISMSVPRNKTITGATAFHSCAPPL